MSPLTTAAVHAAAQRLVDAYARNATDAYFESFAVAASYTFHSEPQLRLDKGEYRSLWNGWQQSGWRVRECISMDPAVQLIGDQGAVFTHLVVTTAGVGNDLETTMERETIVFERLAHDQLLAVHEHLSRHRS